MAKKIRIKFKSKVESKSGKEPIKPQLSGDAGFITADLQIAVKKLKEKRDKEKEQKS